MNRNKFIFKLKLLGFEPEYPKASKKSYNSYYLKKYNITFSFYPFPMSLIEFYYNYNIVHKFDANKTNIEYEITRFIQQVKENYYD